jgi:hypothetical protein
MQKSRLAAAGKSPASSTMRVHTVYCSHAMTSGAYDLHSFFVCLMESLRYIERQVACPALIAAVMLQVGLLTGALSNAARPWDTAEVPLQPPASTELEAASRQVGWDSSAEVQHYWGGMLLFLVGTLSSMSACGCGAAVHVGRGCCTTGKVHALGQASHCVNWVAAEPLTCSTSALCCLVIKPCT